MSRNEYLAEILSPKPSCLHSNDDLIVTTRACSAKIPGLLLYELVQTLDDLILHRGNSLDGLTLLCFPFSGY